MNFLRNPALNVLKSYFYFKMIKSSKQFSFRTQRYFKLEVFNKLIVFMYIIKVKGNYVQI